MANMIDQGDLLHDPEAMLAKREELALRNMLALITISEEGKDERARVSAAAELNKMLSLGLMNRPGTIKATQVNNLRLPAGKAADEATASILAKLAASKERLYADREETTSALASEDDDE